MDEYTVVPPEDQWWNSKKYGMKMKTIIFIGIGISVILLTVLFWRFTVFSYGDEGEGDVHNDFLSGPL